MKNRKFFCALLLVLCLALSACGSSSLSTGDKAAAEAPRESSAFEPNGGGGPTSDGGNMGFAPEEAPGSAGGAYYENTKIIRTADLSLQSTDFDAAVKALNDLVNTQGGYFESSEYSNGGYNSGSSRWGSFTIRVPKENFDAFMDSVGDVAYVTSQVTGIQDVGEAYYDAELHLSTLETKHERLLDLLERAELMEDIISLESALSDVEYQIQQYKSTLTRYDALIDFSTIRVDLREVIRVTENPTEADPLHVRLGAAFSEGWNSFCDGLAEFAVWCAYNFVGLLFFIIIVVLVILLCRRLNRRSRERFAQMRMGTPYTPPHTPPNPPSPGPKNDTEHK